MYNNVKMENSSNIDKRYKLQNDSSNNSRTFSKCPNIFVTADFTTHGGPHLYGLPCPSANSLDPMDHFSTFDVPNIIPKNMSYLI